MIETLLQNLNLGKSNELRSRIAPTPSGFLHLGNGYAFLLTWLLVRSRKGKLVLRIDDIDKSRKRAVYIEDIFQTLDWMGIDWDEGASSVADFESKYSQHLNIDKYQKHLEELVQKGFIFTCDCSRSEIQKRTGNHLYDGFCIDKKMVLKSDYALRINTSLPQSRIDFEDVYQAKMNIDVHQQTPFFVVQKKDKLPAYQLVSLIEDVDMNINFVVRGKDLVASTASQLFLARLLRKDHFSSKTTFLHHPLLLDQQNKKLSKSDGAISMKYLREQGISKAAFFEGFCIWIGLTITEPLYSASELLDILKSKGL